MNNSDFSHPQNQTLIDLRTYYTEEHLKKDLNIEFLQKMTSILELIQQNEIPLSDYFTNGIDQDDCQNSTFIIPFFTEIFIETTFITKLFDFDVPPQFLFPILSKIFQVSTDHFINSESNSKEFIQEWLHQNHFIQDTFQFLFTENSSLFFESLFDLFDSLCPFFQFEDTSQFLLFFSDCDTFRIFSEYINFYNFLNHFISIHHNQFDFRFQFIQNCFRNWFLSLSDYPNSKTIFLLCNILNMIHKFISTEEWLRFVLNKYQVDVSNKINFNHLIEFTLIGFVQDNKDINENEINYLCVILKTYYYISIYYSEMMLFPFLIDLYKKLIDINGFKEIEISKAYLIKIFINRLKHFSLHFNPLYFQSNSDMNLLITDIFPTLFDNYFESSVHIKQLTFQLIHTYLKSSSVTFLDSWESIFFDENLFEIFISLCEDEEEEENTAFLCEDEDEEEEEIWINITDEYLDIISIENSKLFTIISDFCTILNIACNEKNTASFVNTFFNKSRKDDIWINSFKKFFLDSYLI